MTLDQLRDVLIQYSSRTLDPAYGELEVLVRCSHGNRRVLELSTQDFDEECVPLCCGDRA